MITFLRLGGFGRLGNQLWQIASTIGIATKIGVPFEFPRWQYRGDFGNKLPMFIYTANTTYFTEFKEPSTYYNEINLDPAVNWSLSGYFQSPKYFENAEEIIKFYFDLDVKGKRFQLDYVSIHVRRTDYKNLRTVHTNLDETDYYEKAMALFPNRRFLLFSDDIKWCKEHFKDRVHYFESPDEFECMKYMSACESHIIANSSFSWWGAYLGMNPYKQVIYPNKWVETEDRNDRIPNKEEWKGLEI